MLSKKQIKFIRDLSQKKYREVSSCFVVEGPKSVLEMVAAGMDLSECYTLKPIDELPSKIQIVVSSSELKAMSSLVTPQNLIGVFRIPKVQDIVFSGIILALDGVRDPGNFGTIVRLCDWFGVKNLVCSLDSVDCFHPKVVQATMGSLARVNVSYVDLPLWLKSTTIPKIGTFMEATSVYQFQWPNDVIVVMGNEGQGISNEVRAVLTDTISIPKYNPDSRVESLNVASATSVILSEFFRSTTGK